MPTNDMLSQNLANSKIKEDINLSDSSSELCIPTLFEIQAERTPNKVALAFEGKCLTYWDLNVRANQLGHYLKRCGIGSDRLVGICVDRSLEMVIGLLGILKAGGAYVPLDPIYPQDRLAFMVKDADLGLILTQEKLQPHLSHLGTDYVQLDADWSVISQELESNPVSGVHPDSLAYVMYTSGSTGQPKGTSIPHRSVVRLVHHTNYVHLGPEEVFLQFAPLAFDASTFEVWGSLLNGAKLVIFPPHRPSLEELGEVIENQEISTLWLTAGLFHQMVEHQGERLSGVAQVLAGGDVLSPSHVNRFLKQPGKGRLINGYGPTENTTFTCCHSMERGSEIGSAVPIGRPIANTQVFLLSEDFEPVPVGVAGELYIGGDGLARDYLNRPDLTAEKFLPHPFSDEPGERVYRTGDRACYCPDGTFEFLGRQDHQVKLRGFRIELGEIELVLAKHPAVKEVVAVCREDVPGDKRLVAYIIGSLSENSLIPQLRHTLKTQLPEYMIPTTFVVLETMPLTPNGKVDRRALPPPGESRPYIDTTFVEPRTPIETEVANVWAQVLGLHQVGIHDNFFELGGHSLLAMQLLSQLRESCSVNLSMQCLPEAPTIADLALVIKHHRANPSEQTDSDILQHIFVSDPEKQHEPFPLTDIQQAYWIGRHHSFELGNISAHEYMEVDCQDLDLERLSVALQRLIQRHDMLRAIVHSDGQQQILEHVPPYEIKILDLSEKTPEAIEASLTAVRNQMSHQILPSDQWPVFDIRASRLSVNRLRLHFSFDALTLDASSLSLFFREWAQFYQDLETSLAPLGLSFRDYVLAQERLRNSQLYKDSEKYWKARVDRLPPGPDLPLAKDPSSISHPHFSVRCSKLAPEVWRRLKNHATSLGLTPSSILLAAFGEILAVWSKHSRFTLNLTLFNPLPLHPQVRDIMGDFTSLVLLEVDNSVPDSFQSRAQRLQKQLWTDLNFTYVSGVQILRELAKQQSGDPKALMPVVFTSELPHTHQTPESNPLPWMGDLVYRIDQTPQVWLDHVVYEEADALVLNWYSIDELFPDGVLDAMFEGYVKRLEQLADDDGKWHQTWTETANELVPSAQLAQRKIINSTEVDVSESLLHSLFETQVSRNAQNVAVIGPTKSLTYYEVFCRANQLGHQLRARGAKPNQLVAVVMEKGWEQVVAVLGILASGAAYLPLDADLPEERLLALLEHGEVELVVTQPWLTNKFEWPDHIRRIVIEEDFLATEEQSRLNPVQNPKDLAYVIYTSGSTGLPKGVMIDHRGAVNTILDINQRFNVGPSDRGLALSSLSFDLSVYDIFGTLAAGGTLVIPAATGTRDPAYWAQLLLEEEITIWNSVPALMTVLVEYLEQHPELRPLALKAVLMSGDWIPLTLPDSIKALIENVQVISLGGATEASIWSILYPIGKRDASWKSIPYGRPMLNQQFHVLNDALTPCPVWVPGHLHIGGIGLAKGYWRDAEKTQASFITHPQTGEPLYRTGDLGRYLPDGTIEFLGREDFQVKVQGYRTELGEIEAALLQHPAVGTAIVTAVGDRGSDKRLIGYILSRQEPAPTSEDVRQFLGSKLPSYMIPSAFAFIDQLPLTPNGKIDRRALPEPALPDVQIDASMDPEWSELTKTICRLVAQVLKLDSLSLEDNLQNLGATSIDMIRIVNLLETELQFRPPMNAFYRESSVNGLVRLYQQEMAQKEHSPSDGEEHSLSTPTVSSLTRDFELIVDPEERVAFVRQQPGLRGSLENSTEVELMSSDSEESLRAKYLARQSYRQFSSQPISLSHFSEWLGCLRQYRVHDHPKYRYASAGGLYPVQTYLYLKQERIAGLEGGIYYYHPARHRLISLTPQIDLPSDLYDPFINRPIFEQAAFAVFLIVRLRAIAPMYGNQSLHFSAIEAGLMAQLLESEAPNSQLGLCQIGDVEFDRIRSYFALDDTDHLIHSLLGGHVQPHQLLTWKPPFQDKSLPTKELQWEEGEL